MSGNCYKKNFIKKVIAKIDFAEPVDVFTAESLSNAVAEIKKRFPIAEQATASEHGIKISPQGIESSKTEFLEWIFHGSGRTKLLKVNKLFIEILLTKYDSEKDFRDDLIIPITHLLKIKPNITIQRTGIRFVNIFDFPMHNFEIAIDYFSKRITNHFSEGINVENCTRNFLINEFVFDDIKLKIQSGFFNPDYPAIIKRNHFVLDLDAYIDFPHLINDSENYFNELHKIIEDNFELLITDKLREEVLNG